MCVTGGVADNEGYAKNVYARLLRKLTMQAAVIVLGDLGRSPRMQYHARALAITGVDVDLIGEEGTPVPRHAQHARIREHRVRARRGIAGVASAGVALFGALRRISRPDVIVVQTPPAIPTIIVAWLFAKWCGSRLVLDWHNLGWTILAGRSGTAHPVVALARHLERLSARLADAHLAVSEALTQHLRTTWALPSVHVLRDRPAEVFGASVSDDAMRAHVMQMTSLGSHAHPAIVISPTSWTSDETLDVVFAAAERLEDMWHDCGPADGLIIVISGRGAGRAAFDRRLRARAGQRVHVVTTWVSGDDYPVLLAACDAGLSLHRSSSGLDLPMKVCDLFGASLPVCALDYGPTLRELVTPGHNALLFTDAQGLASSLDQLFSTWPTPTPQWHQLHRGAAAVAAGTRWTAGWQREARAVILEPTTHA